MNQHPIVQLICILLFVSLFSCSKNNDIQPTPVTPKYSTTLLKIYEIDTTKQAPGDTISRRFFNYDNANRLIRDSFFTATLYPNDTYSKVKTIEYNGSDTLAFRLINKEFTSQFLSIDTTYYTFINGVYVSDTVKYDYGTNAPRATSKTTFSYQPGVIIRNFQNWIPQYAYSAIERDTIHQTILNSNIVHQSDTTRTFINGQYSGSQTFETTISYLPNPNPFFKLFSATSRGYFNTIGIGNFVNNQYAPEHLISQQTATTGKVTYTYTFRPDGYPLTANVIMEESGNKSVTKLLFVYTQN